VKWIEAKLRELTRVVRALRELGAELAAMALACAGLVTLIQWLWP
jgi:hypothetical protein